MFVKKDGKSAEASLGLTCGTCIYYRSAKLYELPCHDLGVQKYALAPRCFVANTSILVSKIDASSIKKISSICQELEPDTIRLLAYQLSTLAEAQDQGFYFGQKVFFSLGRDFLTHYFHGYVISVREGCVTITAKLYAAEKSTTVILDAKNVLNEEQWQAKSASLIKNNRIVSEKIHRDKYKQELPEILTWEGTVRDDVLEELELRSKRNEDTMFEPPSIDMSPDELLAQARIQSEKKGAKLGKNKKMEKPIIGGTMKQDITHDDHGFATVEFDYSEGVSNE